jgi:hypothetical protein
MDQIQQVTVALGDIDLAVSVFDPPPHPENGLRRTPRRAVQATATGTVASDKARRPRFDPGPYAVNATNRPANPNQRTKGLRPFTPAGA